MPETATRAQDSQSERTAAAKPRGVLYYLGMGVSAGLLALVLLVGAIVIAIPAIAGATPLTVLTSSMEPGLPPGTLIVVKPIETNDIVLGDVLTYQIESGKAGVITHRVTEIINSSDGSRTFTLKGDNNDAADDLPVLPVQVVGKLWYSVPWIGYVSNYVNGESRSWLVPVIAIGLFIYAGFMLMSGIVSSVRTRKRARIQAEHDALSGDPRAQNADTIEDAAATIAESEDKPVRSR
jgi:signal peptidase